MVLLFWSAETGWIAHDPDCPECQGVGEDQNEALEAYHRAIEAIRAEFPPEEREDE